MDIKEKGTLLKIVSCSIAFNGQLSSYFIMKLVIMFACLVAVAVALPVLPEEKAVETVPVDDLVGAEQFFGGYGGGYSNEYYGGYGGYGNFGGYGGYGGYGNYGNFGGFGHHNRHHGHHGFGR